MAHLAVILRTITITVAISKAIKIAGKKDIADIIGMSGWMLCGLNVLQWIQAIQKNPPAILMFLHDIIVFLDKIAGLLSEILETLGGIF